MWHINSCNGQCCLDKLQIGYSCIAICNPNHLYDDIYGCTHTELAKIILTETLLY